MPDYSSFYATLGASPDTDWKTLRARYKRLIGQWHPDRFSADPIEREIAEERSKQITIAYQALDRYRRDHDGELPRVVDPARGPTDERGPMPNADARFDRAGSTAHAQAAPTTDFKKRVPMHRHRAVIAFAAVIAVAYFGYRFIEVWSPDDTPSAEGADTTDLAPQPPAVVENTRESDSISTGSTFGEVYAIQGVPTLTQGDTWYYGKSKIHFSQGKVISWEEHPDSPLRIDHHYPAHSDNRFFRIGSTKDEVRAIQGAPVVETDAVWYYAPSRVYFQNDRVIRWEDSPAQPLKVAR